MRQSDFTDAINNNLGYCHVCKEFTAEGMAPDESECPCEQCGQEAVYAPLQALLEGYITIDEKN